MPSSRPMRGEPDVGGGIGVGAWAPRDGGNGVALDSVTDMTGAGAGARSGVGGLGSGQRTIVGGGKGIGGSGIPAADGLNLMSTVRTWRELVLTTSTRVGVAPSKVHPVRTVRQARRPVKAEPSLSQLVISCRSKKTFLLQSFF